MEKRVEGKHHGVRPEGLPGFGHPHPPTPPHTPRQPLDAFDAKAEAWEDYMATPLGRLRQKLTLHYLAQHIGALPRSLRILDAGGGTASYALPLAHTLVALPFVVCSLLPVIRGIHPHLREAARVLGASSWQVWREVDLPIVGRALLVGAAFAFTISLGEFGATVFVA